MENWAELEAEKMIDAFVSYQASDDLLKLQQAIATALCRAYERGTQGRGPGERQRFGLDEKP